MSLHCLCTWVKLLKFSVGHRITLKLFIWIIVELLMNRVTSISIHVFYSSATHGGELQFRWKQKTLKLSVAILHVLGIKVCLPQLTNRKLLTWVELTAIWRLWRFEFFTCLSITKMNTVCWFLEIEGRRRRKLCPDFMKYWFSVTSYPWEWATKMRLGIKTSPSGYQNFKIS